MKPLVSVVMACFNGKGFLKDSIPSVVQQTYTNWELVICDDCSSDNSFPIAEQLAKGNNVENKVRIIRNKKNRGYGNALRTCIDHSTGELIAILDVDDYLEPTALEVMVDNHLKNPDVSLVYSRFYECDGRLKKGKVENKSNQIPPGKSFLELHHQIKVSHLKCFKKSFYDKTEGVNPHLMKAVDKDLVLKLEEVGRILFIPDVLYRHRNHSKSISLTFKYKPAQFKNRVMWDKKMIFDQARQRRKRKKKNDR